MIPNHDEKKQSQTIDLSVSHAQLQKYLRAINETNEFYQSSSLANQAGFADIPLPATYPAVFWQDFSLPWLTNDMSLMLTEQIFNYVEPLTINQQYQGHITLDKVRKLFNKQWATHKLHIYKKTTLIATVQTTLVITGDEILE